MDKAENARSRILREANDIVNGDRNNSYGSPEDSFARIADLWSGYLQEEITSFQVGMMMILLKVARTEGAGSMDNFIDIAGYAACSGEIYNKLLEM